MMTMKHILNGMKVVRRNWPLVAIAFLFKFGFAFLFLMPLQGLVSGAFSNRPGAGRLLSEWNLTPIIDFVYYNHGALEQYGYFILVAIIIAFMFHTFISGGFFRTLTMGLREEQNVFTAKRFFGWCGYYFWRFVKIAIASAIFYLVIAVLFIILSELVTHLILGKEASEPVRFFITLGRITVFALLLLVANLVIMYTKIAAVVHEHPSLLDMLGSALQFLRNTFWRALTLWAELLIGLFLIMLMYWILFAVCNVLPTTSSIITLFFVQQTLSLTRSWYRLVAYASQTGLYLAKSTVENFAG